VQKEEVTSTVVDGKVLLKVPLVVNREGEGSFTLEYDPTIETEDDYNIQVVLSTIRGFTPSIYISTESQEVGTPPPKLIRSVSSSLDEDNFTSEIVVGALIVLFMVGSIKYGGRFFIKKNKRNRI
jgi:hypothetical protein